MLLGMILLWSGALVDIPPGFALCDGSNGTPDLRDRFVPGAGATYNPGDTGGADSHVHDFTSDSHKHTIETLSDVAGDSLAYRLFDDETGYAQAVGTTDSKDGRPKYYALYYVMYVGL